MMTACEGDASGVFHPDTVMRMLTHNSRGQSCGQLTRSDPKHMILINKLGMTQNKASSCVNPVCRMRADVERCRQVTTSACPAIFSKTLCVTTQVLAGSHCSGYPSAVPSAPNVRGCTSSLSANTVRAGRAASQRWSSGMPQSVCQIRSQSLSDLSLCVIAQVNQQKWESSDSSVEYQRDSLERNQGCDIV